MLFEKLTGEGEDPCSWTEVTLRELKAFLGLLVAMSTQQLSSLQDYWFTDWILGVPAFAKVMPRNSFLEIWSNIHLAENSKTARPGDENFDNCTWCGHSLRTEGKLESQLQTSP